MGSIAAGANLPECPIWRLFNNLRMDSGLRRNGPVGGVRV
jgi:hypothetical protein